MTPATFDPPVASLPYTPPPPPDDAVWAARMVARRALDAADEAALLDMLGLEAE